MITAVQRPQKRLFLSLLVLSLILAGLSVYGIWQVILPGLVSISHLLPYFLGTLLAVFLLLGASGILGIVLAILGWPTPKIFHGIAWSVVTLLFPVALRLGKMLDIEKEKIERSFIEMSNHLIQQKQVQVEPQRLLILTPHCIQQDDCPYKITKDIHNCHRCGRCQVGELAALADKYGVHLAIVTGGTLARKVVKTLRPQAILAIACERDLTSGIQDVFPLPVIGVLNERPCGPCCNTRVDMKKVETTIQQFLKKGEINEGS